ncbi:MAG: hypothetical protein ACXWWD_01785 [Chitinophagaceae bacterium]
MPSRLYYTIPASLLLEENKGGFNIENAKLNILVNDETEFTPHLYSTLASMESEYIVSLSASFLAKREVSPDLLSRIYLLIVLNQNSKGQRIVPIISKGEYKGDTLHIGKVQTYLNQQGLCNINLPLFNCSVTGIQTIDNCSFFVISDPSADLKSDLLKNIEYNTTMIIASGNEIADLAIIPELSRQIISDEGTLNDDISRFYIEKEEFEIEKELWKKRTLLYQDFLSLSKAVQEKEYYDVLNWYRREYEILPLWYKRVGHIIKVVMGKRRFRSLFRDDVKKHKD